MRNIIVFGPPGSGKGTQATLMAERHGLQHISTGELLRREVARGTELGQRLQHAMAVGELVPDEVVTQLVSDLVQTLPRNSGGIILDGYPRTLDQSIALTDILYRAKVDIAHVFELRIPDDMLVERVAGRFSCVKCGAGYHDTFKVPEGDCCGAGWERRPEDNADALRVRLARYHRNVREVLYQYNTFPYFHVIDAALPMDKVAAQLDVCISVEA
jgi:adenylate kinase